MGQKALILAILEDSGKAQNGQKSRKSTILRFPESAKWAKKPLFWRFWRILGCPKWTKITKICNFALSGIRKIGQKAAKICNFALSGICKIGQKAHIFAILADSGKPKMVKNHENLRFCAFRNLQKRPKSPYFAPFCMILVSPKWSKITKICNFALSGIRKIGQKALIFAILSDSWKLKMVKNHENCAVRNPQKGSKSLYIGNFEGFWETQNSQKSRKSAILRVPESAK